MQDGMSIPREKMTNVIPGRRVIPPMRGGRIAQKLIILAGLFGADLSVLIKSPEISSAADTLLSFETKLIEERDLIVLVGLS
jgi:hypothetical protein